MLQELKIENNELLQEANELKEDMMKFHHRIIDKITAATKKSPLIIKQSQKVPTNLVFTKGECSILPSPVIPTVKK
jgi:hypothetical protein